jgi:sulfopyruvate decarboxylase alpha subunit
MTDAEQGWPEAVYRELLRADVRQVGYVPDSGISRLIELCHAGAATRAVPLTTEEEGIALLAGAWLGGQRGALLMQSSGIGNCINMLTLTRACRFPLLMIVTMRGQPGETNPWQLPMGGITADVLGLADVSVREAATADSIAGYVAEAACAAFDGPAAAAVLIAQSVIGVKVFED